MRLNSTAVGSMHNACIAKVPARVACFGYKVNGPEILNKYVGASEENVRKLFEDAEKDWDFLWYLFNGVMVRPYPGVDSSNPLQLMVSDYSLKIPMKQALDLSYPGYFRQTMPRGPWEKV